MLTAGLVLAIMVIPFISSVMREVFLTVPTRLKESAYALGSTTWEVVWDIVLPYTRSAVIGGIFLGLGRALGETMAVTFVIGNAVQLHARRCWSRAPPSPRSIANEFGEATEPMYRSALLALGFVLFVVTFVVLAIARLMLRQPERARRATDERIRRRPACPAPPRSSNAHRAWSLSVAAPRVFGLFCLAWILWTTLRQGHRRIEPGAVHPDDRRRPARKPAACSTPSSAAW